MCIIYAKSKLITYFSQTPHNSYRCCHFSYHCSSLSFELGLISLACFQKNCWNFLRIYHDIPTPTYHIPNRNRYFSCIIAASKVREILRNAAWLICDLVSVLKYEKTFMKQRESGLIHVIRNILDSDVHVYSCHRDIRITVYPIIDRFFVGFFAMILWWLLELWTSRSHMNCWNNTPYFTVLFWHIGRLKGVIDYQNIWKSIFVLFLSSIVRGTYDSYYKFWCIQNLRTFMWYS